VTAGDAEATGADTAKAGARYAAWRKKPRSLWNLVRHVTVRTLFSLHLFCAWLTLKSSTACQYEWQAVRDWAQRSFAGSDANDLGGVQSLRASLNLEFDFLPLGQGFEPFHCDRGEVYEDVLSAFLLNEAIPLGVIEPLHFPSGHSSCLLRAAYDA
jgi:hypothetical protein